MAIKSATCLLALALGIAGAAATAQPEGCCLPPQMTMTERMDAPSLMPSPGLWTLDVSIDYAAKKLSSTISNSTMHWRSLALGATMYSIDLNANKCYKMVTPPSVFGNIDPCVGAKSTNHKSYLTGINIAGVDAGVWGKSGSDPYDPKKDMPVTVTVDSCTPVGMGDGSNLAVFYNFTNTAPPANFQVPSFCNSAASVDSAAAVPHPTLRARSGFAGLVHHFA
mmetsp:Transcript_68932/g.190847  ORF Transcript_68932/g.190847 Transcript_68932/m.190847 type:complete len:223 (-) Transcript_68932:128-796(-)